MFHPEVLREIIVGGGVAYKEGTVSYIFSCPRCRKARKLYIRKTDGKFVCFVCKEDGFYGKAEFALHELFNLPTQEIKAKLYGDTTVQFSNFMDLKFESPWLINEEFGLEESPEGIGEVTFPEFFKGVKNGDEGYEYLTNKRGIDWKRIEKYQLSFNPKWRTVVFPAYLNKTLIGWQERSTISDFKYTLKGFKKEQTLMFLNNLEGSRHAVLAEGPVDGIKADLCGGNVVSMGKGISEQQLDIIKSRVKVLYLALDPDATKELDRICRYMYDYMEEIRILLPPKGRKDLGESTFEEVFEQFNTAPKYCGQVFFNLKVR